MQRLRDWVGAHPSAAAGPLTPPAASAGIPYEPPAGCCLPVRVLGKAPCAAPSGWPRRCSDPSWSSACRTRQTRRRDGVPFVSSRQPERSCGVEESPDQSRHNDHRPRPPQRAAESAFDPNRGISREAAGITSRPCGADHSQSGYSLELTHVERQDTVSIDNRGCRHDQVIRANPTPSRLKLCPEMGHSAGDFDIKRNNRDRGEDRRDGV